MNKIIEIKNLSFSYCNCRENKNYILKNLNCNIYENEFVAIIGENGAGKSTLLNIILKKIIAKEGEIKLFGDDIKENNHYKDISYISQNSVLTYKNFPTTIEEVIKNHLSYLKKKETISHYLKIFNLEEHKKKSLSELSGGELQRVALIIALIKESRLIILDEPTSNIDKKFARELFVTLKKLTEENKTIVMVTHDLHEAGEFVDYAIKIRAGTCHKCLKDNLEKWIGK